MGLERGCASVSPFVCLHPICGRKESEPRKLHRGILSPERDLQSGSHFSFWSWPPLLSTAGRFISQQVSTCLWVSCCFDCVELALNVVSRVSPADFLQVFPPTPSLKLLACHCQGRVGEASHEGSLCVQLWFLSSTLHSGEKLALGPCPVPGVTAETWLLSKRHEVAQEL